MPQPVRDPLRAFARTPARAALVVTAALLVIAGGVGCKSRFTGERLNTLELGTSTVYQAKALLGTPRGEETITDAGVQHQQLTYLADGNAFQGEAARLAVLDFLNDRLVAYSFFGLAKNDQHPMDNAAAATVQVGHTTRDELLRTFGPPSGKAIPGTVLPDFKDAMKPGVAEVWQYLSGNAGWSSVTINQHMLALNGSGTVASITQRQVTRR